MIGVYLKEFQFQFYYSLYLSIIFYVLKNFQFMFIFVSTDEKFHFSIISRFSFILLPLEVSDFDDKIVVNFIIDIIDNLQNYGNQC